MHAEDIERVVITHGWLEERTRSVGDEANANPNVHRAERRHVYTRRGNSYKTGNRRSRTTQRCRPATMHPLDQGPYHDGSRCRCASIQKGECGKWARAQGTTSIETKPSCP